MKNLHLQLVSGCKKSVFLVVSFLLLAISLAGQNVFSNYQDGRIYLKFRDSEPTSFTVHPDNSVDISEIPFLSGLKDEFGLDGLSRPFNLNGDAKLLRTLLLDFKDVQKVETLLARLNQVPQLEYAEKVPYDRIDFVPNDTLYTLYNGPQNWNWHLDRIQAELAWNVTQGSPEIRVAIVDNAVWVDHPDLAGKIVAQRDTYYNTNSANPPSTGDPLEWSHGTHCSGLAAGSTDNGIGIASIGFNVGIIAVKAAANTNANGIYGYPGIQWAADNGADVISMSWGGTGYSQTNQNLINTIHGMGIVLVAAAGNENVSTPHYPSSYANVISVASTDFDDLKSDFSNFSTTVDLSSPGGICSGGPSGLLSTTFSTGTYGNYDLLSGTSMATPIVSGLAGLILSINPLLSPDDVELILKNTADDIYPLNPNYTGMLGAGRINAYKAVMATPFSPVADFSTEVTTIVPGSNGITFTDHSTGVPSTWEWTFEGGIPASASGQIPPPVVYTTPGTYDVSLTVTNDFGSNSAVFPDYITVTATPAPYILIGISDTMPCVSAPVMFSDSSLYDPAQWEWSISPSSYEFVNGTGPESQNPEVMFLVPGFYSVSLSAWNGNGSATMNYPDLIEARGAVPSYDLDMEDGTAGYFTLWDTIKSQIAVDSRSASGSLKSIHFHGDPVPVGWKGSPTSGTPDQAWNENRQFQSEARLCGVDARGMENVALELDLRQTYSLGPRYSWFRVLVNGTQLADEEGIMDFNPLTAGDDPWQRLTFDLSAYAGSVFELTLQASTRFSYHSQGEGDNVFVDNINIINTTNVAKETSNPDEISIFPNPSDGKFSVMINYKQGPVAINVYSMTGVQVYSSTRYNTGSALDLSALPAGVYLLSVNTGPRLFNRRIILR